MNATAFRFDRYTLDLARACLRCGSEDIELRPKSFDVLRYLVENAGRVVSKDEIFAAVWPHVIVTDDSLVQCVGEIRQALKDDATRLVKTIPRRGYRFDAPVTTVEITSPVVAVKAARDAATAEEPLLPPDTVEPRRARRAVLVVAGILLFVSAMLATCSISIALPIRQSQARRRSRSFSSPPARPMAANARTTTSATASPTT